MFRFRSSRVVGSWLSNAMKPKKTSDITTRSIWNLPLPFRYLWVCSYKVCYFKSWSSANVHRRQFVHFQIFHSFGTTTSSVFNNRTVDRIQERNDRTVITSQWRGYKCAPASRCCTLVYCISTSLERLSRTAPQIIFTECHNNSYRHGVVYGLYSYQTSVRANELAAHAIELAMRESCRAHPVSHSILLCLVKLITNLYFSKRRGSPKNRFMSSNASESWLWRYGGEKSHTCAPRWERIIPTIPNIAHSHHFLHFQNDWSSDWFVDTMA
jgi:hypothetical protein